MRDIKGFEGRYAVTSCGRIWSYRSKRFLKPGKDKDGYLFVMLGKGNPRKVHRLVAEAYIPNPDNLKEVNHIDKNRQNNCLQNLEWCNRRQNNIHGLGKKVRCIETGEEFASISLAAEAFNISSASVSYCCSGKIKSCKGKHFEFI